MAQLLTTPTMSPVRSGRRIWLMVAGAVLAWLFVYNVIQPLADWLTYTLIGLQRGSQLGDALAFMMAVVGLSLPELIILRRVLKPQLIVTFVGVVALGIIIIGYLFNLLI